MRLYALIGAKLATMQELKTCYTLGEALRVYAMMQMERDIEAHKAYEMTKNNT